MMQRHISRNDRNPVELSATVRLPDGREVAANVTDLSREGCRVESEVHLPIGDWVRVMVPGYGDYLCMVRWSLLGSAGVRFAAYQG